VSDWREKALHEIGSIKPFWIAKYGWNPSFTDCDDHIDLYVRFARRSSGTECQAASEFVLRLRYQSDFETAGRREAFVNPKNLEEEGTQFWPEGARGVNPKQAPATICLEGTWGFHSHHHRDRDGRVARLNRLLLELEQCLNG
jgi:hypothetical protein